MLLSRPGSLRGQKAQDAEHELITDQGNTYVVVGLAREIHLFRIRKLGKHALPHTQRKLLDHVNPG